MGGEQSTAAKNDIVVVNKDPNVVQGQETISTKKLSKFQPLLQHSANYGFTAADHCLLKQLSPAHLIQLITLYEEHLRQSSSVVALQQTSLAQEIKQSDQKVSKILSVSQKKHSVYKVWSSNIQSSISDINSSLTAIQSNIDGLIPLVNELNNLLPIDDRMPDFTQQPD